MSQIVRRDQSLFARLLQFSFKRGDLLREFECLLQETERVTGFQGRVRLFA